MYISNTICQILRVLVLLYTIYVKYKFYIYFKKCFILSFFNKNKTIQTDKKVNSKIIIQGKLLMLSDVKTIQIQKDVLVKNRNSSAYTNSDNYRVSCAFSILSHFFFSIFVVMFRTLARYFPSNPWNITAA